jgi:hypothetical protein
MERELKEKIIEAIGEASMCWKPIPTGTFDSEKAVEIANRLILLINETRRLDAEFK